MRSVVVLGALVAFVVVTGACVPTQLPLPETPVVGLVETPTHDRVQVLRGSKQAGTAIDIAGVVAVSLDGNNTWEAPVSLVEGLNTFTVVASDARGQKSQPATVSILVDTEAPNPPVLNPAPPTRTQEAKVTLAGSIGASERLVVDGDVVPLESTTFSISRALPNLGDNIIRLASRDLAGNESSVVELHIERVALDVDAPVVNVSTPVDGALVRDSVDVAGVEGDASAVSISVCPGNCPNPDAPTIVDAGAAGAFGAHVDLSALPDDGPVTLTITATDEWGNANTLPPLHLVRAAAPATIDAIGAALTSVSSGNAPFDMEAAWLDNAGALHRSTNAGPDFTPLTSSISIGVSSFAATHLNGDALLAVAYVDSTGVHFVAAAAAPENVVAAGPDPITSVDVAHAGGAFAVAAIEGENVVVSSRSGIGTWTAPATVSDGVTNGAHPSNVAIAFRTDGNVVVAWVESSARDGSANDADVVAVEADPATGALTPIRVVSANNGAFVDAASSAPKLASLGTSTAIAWLDGGDAWVTTLDDASFSAGTIAEPERAATGVDEIALSSTGSVLALATHDAISSGGIGVQIGANAATLADASVQRVPGSQTAQSASIAIAGSIMHVAFVDGAHVFVYPLEIAP